MSARWQGLNLNRRWRFSLLSLGLHAAVGAAVLLEFSSSSPLVSRGTLSRVDAVSPRPAVKPVLEVRLIDRHSNENLIEQPKPQVSAGPIASDIPFQTASVPVKPKKIEFDADAATGGVETIARPLTPVLINPIYVPPQITELKARIWIDEAGLPERAELITQLMDPEAEEHIRSALMDAIYIPAEKGGKTVKSVAIVQLGRGAAEDLGPLLDAGSVVTSNLYK
jgi:hypothetical protein